MFSTRLKQLRSEEKISQSQLAKMLYVSQQTVAKWETDKATPNPETLVKIAGVFQVSVDNLLGLDKNVFPSHEKNTPYEPLITAYKNADEGTRRAVDKLLDLEPME